jgi:hypothetical protein
VLALTPSAKKIVISDPFDIATMWKLLERYASQHEIVLRVSRLQAQLIEQDADDKFKRTAFDLVLECNKALQTAIGSKSGVRAAALNAPTLCAAMHCSAVLFDRLARRVTSVAALVDETLVLTQQYASTGGKTLTREARFATHALLSVLFGVRRRAPPARTPQAEKLAAKQRTEIVKLLRNELELVATQDRAHVLQTLQRFVASTAVFSQKEVDSITSVGSFLVMWLCTLTPHAHATVYSVESRRRERGSQRSSSQRAGRARVQTGAE